MVSIRCKMVVRSEIEKLRLSCISVELGEAEIAGEITDEQHEGLRDALQKTGLELMGDQKKYWLKKQSQQSSTSSILLMNR